jgi:hypothetical protein
VGSVPNVIRRNGSMPCHYPGAGAGGFASFAWPLFGLPSLQFH